MSNQFSRREFIKRTAAVGTAGAVVGYWSSLEAAESTSPNEKLGIACIGAGGKGDENRNGVREENIVALCDVDENRLNRAAARDKNAKKYADFRKMLEEQKDIDAVVVTTPDHTHAVAAVMAMKMGKHCYCEKPLTHSVYEARVMRDTAAKHKVATQMGNQFTADSGFRTAVEVVQSGTIGKIGEVHVWTDRPRELWSQGISRPTDTPPVPSTLSWDLWLGPAAERPYHPAYHPFKWRGWWDFGTGSLGDMACHTMNLPYMALKLDAPTTVEAESSGLNPDTAPTWSVVTWQFPARGNQPPVKFTWYDSSRYPADALKPYLDDLQKLDTERDKVTARVRKSGVLMIGDKGALVSPDDYNNEYILLPSGDFTGYKPPDASLPRSPGHYKEWFAACRGGTPAMSNFGHAARMTETILLGNVALRVGKKLEWDAASMKCVGCPEADQYIKPEFRKGWIL